MTVTITQDIRDIAGVPDNAVVWFDQAGDPRAADDGVAMISTRRISARPVAGVLTVELEPGPCRVQFANGRAYPFVVPSADGTLLPLILEGLATAPAGPAYVVSLGALGVAAELYPGLLKVAIVTASWILANPEEHNTLYIVMPDP